MLNNVLQLAMVLSSLDEREHLPKSKSTEHILNMVIKIETNGLGWAGLPNVVFRKKFLLHLYMALCRILKDFLGTFNKYFHSKYIFLSLPL